MIVNLRPLRMPPSPSSPESSSSTSYCSFDGTKRTTDARNHGSSFALPFAATFSPLRTNPGSETLCGTRSRFLLRFESPLLPPFLRFFPPSFPSLAPRHYEGYCWGMRQKYNKKEPYVVDECVQDHVFVHSFDFEMLSHANGHLQLIRVRSNHYLVGTYIPF